MTNTRRALSAGLAAAALAIALTYVLGAHALLQTPQAEEGHNLFMSLIKGIAGGHESMSQMHNGITSPPDSQTQGMSESHMQGMSHGILGNNVLGGPAGMAAAGFAAVVVIGTVPLAVAAFAISWKQRSYAVAGLLAASGITLMILPLASMNFVMPGPIIGAAAGLAILGLGAAKGIRTARTAKVAAK